MEPGLSRPDITGIAPFFIVRDVPAALEFYRDRLGFDITFQGPEPGDIVPNHTRDAGKGWARWDAYLHVPDPDALAAEFSSRDVAFVQPLKDDDDGLRGFAVQDGDGYVLFFGRPR